MYGKTHTDDAIKKQKDKAAGRYTLEWFIDRYGKRAGKRQYNKRREGLSNRPVECFSHPCDMKGKVKGPMSAETKQKITDTKNKMKTQKKLLIYDIRSSKYTISQLCKKYGVGMTAIKYYKRKLRAENKL
jgi:hypothetical protein